MSNIKFSTGLFLEKVELERFKKFIQTDGFEKYFLENSAKFGLIKNEIDNTFTNGQITEGTALTLNQAEIRGFDSNGKFIYKAAETGLAIPTTGAYYWLKIKYAASNYELGTYSIDTSGNLVCTSGDGELLTILRGQPNFPARVKFDNSTDNTLEYDVLEVIDNNNAVLQGTFIAESDLKLIVVGTFAPGFVAPAADKDIFEYDSCTLSFVLETTLNTPPTLIDGEEFLLARVRNTGSVIDIEDKRYNYIYQSKDNYFLRNLDVIANPVIGVERIKFDAAISTQTHNLCHVAWGLRSTNWSFNAKLNIVTFNTCEGGRYKPNDVSLFTNGDLDGWRLYSADGRYCHITSSSVSGSQLNFTLDSADLDYFTDTTQELLVTPNVEEIELIFTADVDVSTDLPDIRVTYPINTPFLKVPLLVYQDTDTLYNFQYRYKHLRDYSPILTPQGDPAGFYNEEQFDTNGNLIALPTRTSYNSSSTDGYIPLILAPNAYTNVISRLDPGDILGVNTTTLQIGNQVTQLYVGTDKKYQHIYSVGSATLIQDLYFNLNSTRQDLSDLKEGNSFMFHIQQPIVFGSYTISFVQNYVDTSTFDLIHEVTVDVEDFLTYNIDGLYLIFTWSDTDQWIVKTFNENTLAYVKDTIDDSFIIQTYSASLLSAATGTWTIPDDTTFSAMYRKIGKTITANYYITGGTLSANTINVKVTLPNSWVVKTLPDAKHAWRSAGDWGGGTPTILNISAFQGQTWITFSPIDASEFPTIANPFSITGQITFEIE